MFNQSSSMTISTIWRIPCWSFVFYPEQGLSVKNSQMTVIFLSVVSTENKELFIVQSCSMILDLWCAQHFTIALNE